MKEVFKPIKDYENLYRISNLGNIESLEKKWPISNGGVCIRKKQKKKQITSIHGYKRVWLWKNKKCKVFASHRLVAQEFIPNYKNKPQINHKNGIKTDNRAENLEWVTPSENNKHAFKIGLKTQKGNKNNARKLTMKQADFIKKSKIKPKMLAKKFNVSTGCIYKILHKKSWT
jgi:hypothetical protein